MISQKKLNQKRAKHRASRKGKKYSGDSTRIWVLNTERAQRVPDTIVV